MAKKEYIEREALIKYAEKQEVIIKDGLNIADAMRIQGNVFRRCVETCPAADVVEVVRCKDCIFRGREDCAMYYECECGEQHTWETDNDFCSYGAKNGR